MNYLLDKARKGDYTIDRKSKKGVKPMKYNPPKFKSLSEMASIDVGRLTEDQARKMLEDIRWPKGPVCPHCGNKNVTRINGKAEKVRDGLIQCKQCRKQFTVTLGTIMQGSHITLRQWLQAFHSMSSHKKGVSALQLQRNLGLHSYNSAWHLAHRIRFAMQTDPVASALKGVVEVDETYIGGKTKGGKRGRGAERKTPVVALVERGGKAHSRPIERVNAKTLKGAIREMVDRDSTIMTDEWESYTGIGKEFKGGHRIIKHRQGEYSKEGISTNTAESFFALLKRGVHGTFHHVSKTHLRRYCDEFSFRWNQRKVSDGNRATEAIKGIVGKSLSYRALVGRA
jgi:transposase-like protein